MTGNVVALHVHMGFAKNRGLLSLVLLPTVAPLLLLSETVDGSFCFPCEIVSLRLCLEAVLWVTMLFH